MDKTWKAELHIFVYNPPEWKYINVDFPVTDEEYEQMNKAVLDGTEFRKLPFYHELLDRAEKELDPRWLVDEWYLPPEPIPEKYEDEEEYQEALEEYNSWEFSNYDIWDVVLDDPGECERFKKTFIGRKLDEDFREDEIELDDYEHMPQKEAIVLLTISDDGTIEDVKVEHMAVGGGENERYIEFNECEPEYWWIERELENYLKGNWAE